MPQPSAFDPPQGVQKGDGQVYQTGAGNQGNFIAQSTPPAAVHPAVDPSVAGGIKTLMAALAQAFAPKSITQAPQREKAAEDAALGNQF